MANQIQPLTWDKRNGIVIPKDLYPTPKDVPPSLDIEVRELWRTITYLGQCLDTVIAEYNSLQSEYDLLHSALKGEQI